MKKFILSLLGLALLSVMGIIATYAVMIYRYQPKLASIYSIAPNQDVLFLGSSQIGCGVRRLPKYHHKLIWYMTSTFPTFEIHLRELERRGQLDGVKLLIMNLNTQTLQQFSRTYTQRCWHRALPLFWRYWRDYPDEYLTFACYAINHLDEVTAFAVSDGEADHASITEKSPQAMAEFLRNAAEGARHHDFSDNLPDFEHRLCNAMDDIKEIANKHHIRVVAVRMPLIGVVENNIPDAEYAAVGRLADHARAIGIQYIDLGRFDDKWFIDEVHLSSAGSEVFMSRLYDTLGLKVNE